MATQFAWILMAVLLAPAPAPGERSAGLFAGGAQHDRQKGSKQNEPRRQRFVKWWIEEGPRAELGITDQQSAAIEKIFQAHLPGQRQRHRELEALEPALAKLIKEGTAHPDVVAREVERVEDLTAAVRKARITTLYRMQHELTADQRARLKAMDDRRRRDDSHKSSEPGRRH